jgi:hypothetical protein
MGGNVPWRGVTHLAPPMWSAVACRRCLLALLAGTCSSPPFVRTNLRPNTAGASSRTPQGASLDPIHLLSREAEIDALLRLQLSPWSVYNRLQKYTPENPMAKAALTRTNLLLETGKIRQLRKVLRSRSNSEAVRLAIDERLAVETGLCSLKKLRKSGGVEDLFGRAPAMKK